MLFADLINISNVNTVYIVLGKDTEFTDSPYLLSVFKDPLLTLWGDHEVLYVAPGTNSLYIKIAEKPFKNVQQKLLMENMFEVTQEAICLDYLHQLNLPEDSRELFETCYAIACQFEKDYLASNDYLLSISEYARHHILLNYGRPEME